MERTKRATQEPSVAAKPRVFKAKIFARSCRKVGISDKELCAAVAELAKGLGDSLGGNVWKKRLNNNMHRAIVVAKPGRFWLFVYLFAKQDRDNIDNDELVAFRKLAKDVGKADAAKLDELVTNGEYQEICK